MVYSLYDYFNLIKPYLPNSIVNQDSLLLLEKVTKQLPIVPIFLLESRLSDSCDRIDLSLGIKPKKISQEEILINSPFWQKLLFFSEIWTISGTIANKMVEDIWLEIDLDSDINNLLIPCFFITFNSQEFRNIDIDEKLLIIQKISSFFIENYRINKNKVNVLKHCLKKLPDSSSMVQIGIMLSRGKDKIRVNIENLKGLEIWEYLGKITNIEPDQKLKEIISIFTPLSDRIILTFDLENENIGSRIGLECFLNKQPQKEVRWDQFLKILVEMNCCTPEKKEDLLNWSGLIQKKDILTSYPQNLKEIEPWMEKEIISVFFRTINHLKLIYQPNLPLEAKAYLGFGHSWFNSRQGFRV